MYVNGIKCDSCSKMHNMNIIKEDLPQEWFVLVKTGHDEKMHFCCIECLFQWTSCQTMDSRKFDVEVPVGQVFPSFRNSKTEEEKQEDLEYWRNS